MLHALLLTFGLIALIFSSEALIRGASGLARSFGVPSLVSNATVFAFVTGAPALAVALKATAMGSPHVALGVVVGGNIFAVLVILGLAASLVPLVAGTLFVRLEVPALIIACLLLAMLAADGAIGLVDGVILLAALGGFTVLLVIYSLHDMEEIEDTPSYDGPDRRGRIWRKYGKAHRILFDACLVVFGIMLLSLGVDWLVEPAITLGARFGMDETVASLTVLAGCTALPGAIAALLATLRDEPEIAVGTVLGSSVFSILGVVGLAALLTPGGLAAAPSLVSFDIPVLLAAAIACLPLIFIGNRIEPWHGVVLLAVYVGYVFYLVTNPDGHASADGWRMALLTFVLPTAVLTFAIIVWRKLWAITEAEA